jgi:hypothetical protein
MFIMDLQSPIYKSHRIFMHRLPQPSPLGKSRPVLAMPCCPLSLHLFRLSVASCLFLLGSLLVCVHPVPYPRPRRISHETERERQRERKHRPAYAYPGYVTTATVHRTHEVFSEWVTGESTYVFDNRGGYSGGAGGGGAGGGRRKTSQKEREGSNVGRGPLVGPVRPAYLRNTSHIRKHRPDGGSIYKPVSWPQYAILLRDGRPRPPILLPCREQKGLDSARGAG